MAKKMKKMDEMPEMMLGRDMDEHMRSTHTGDVMRDMAHMSQGEGIQVGYIPPNLPKFKKPMMKMEMEMEDSSDD
jgi:hypothetical protein